MLKYICIRKNFDSKQLWEEGQIVTVKEDDPELSHHFKRIDGDVVITEVKKTEIDENEPDKDAIESLRIELEKVGGTFDRRWGRVKLEHQLIITKKERGLD